MATSKPNLLFLIADDHAGYVMGRHTPNLERLATQGTRFANNICNSPVCTPSRQSILTGLYPHAAGVTTLKTPLSESKPTLAKLLQNDSYQTATFGKMHFNSPGKDGMHGFSNAMTEDRINRGWQQSINRPRPPWRPFRDPASQWLNSAKQALPYSVEEMRSSWQLTQAKRWLDTNHKDAPFAMWFSIQEPHSPFDFPTEDQQLYDPRRVAVPKVGPEDAWQIPNIFRSLTIEQKQGIIAAYYTSAHYLDRTMGRMLAHLDQLNLAENTLVVYMADHGYSLGHHGRFEKHCFYQPAMHVPLIFRFPGKIAANKTVRHYTESVDVATTISRLLNLKDRVPVTHGRDLFTAPARDEIFSVYLENEEACLLWDRWKLIYTTGRRKREDGYETENPTPGKIVRLYDRKQDPDEFTNVAAKHPALVQTLTHKLEQKFLTTHPEPGLTLDAYLRPRDAG